MANLDLTPNDYRLWLGQRQLFVRCGLALALGTFVVIAGTAFAAKAVRTTQAVAAELRAKNAITQQQQQQLQSLQEQQAEYQRQWTLLRGLRAGAAVEDIFRIVDESLVVDRLWFLDWSFRRAGILVDEPQRGVDSGYFIIVSEEDGDRSGDTYEVQTHMSIHGQAKDHQALSAFVRALFSQDLIKDVNVQRTSRGGQAAGRVVDFNITVVLNSSAKDS